MSLIYFSGPARTITRAQVVELGLGYTLDAEDGLSVRGGNVEGKSGCFFARAGHGSRPEDLGPREHWIPYPGKDGLWVGWNSSDMPGPGYFARPGMLHGHPVKLADGNEWTVPVARWPDGSSPFPRRLSFSGTEWVESDEPSDSAHRDLWATACDYWARSLGGEPGEPVTLTQETDLTAIALGLNYRVGPAELTALGLLTTETPAEVCLALVDFPSIRLLLAPPPTDNAEEIPSKNSDGLTPSRGPEDSFLDTAQPSLTSTL